MPQLDKVTLFSQVFWLIFLYFVVFLVILKFYLPNFSKVFKIRSYYLLSSFYEKSFVSWHYSMCESFSKVLNQFQIALEQSLNIITEYYVSLLVSFNIKFFKTINYLFITSYILTSLKLNFFKKLFLV